MTYTEGFVKGGGWGANTDPNTWEIVQQNSPSYLFKVVDSSGQSVASHFQTRESAQQFIDVQKDPMKNIIVPGSTSTPEPTPETTGQWTSAAWANGQKRTITSGKIDPSDPRLLVIGGTVTINGDGTATLADGVGTFPRLFIKGPWKNTETTFQAKAASFKWIQVRGRSNHEDRDNCGLGGRHIYYRGNKSMAAKIEYTHPIYTTSIGSGSFNFKPNTWQGYRLRETGNLLEGFFDELGNGIWKKVFEATASKDWELANPESHYTEFQTFGRDRVYGNLDKIEDDYVWNRTDDPKGVVFRNYSVKPI